MYFLDADNTLRGSIDNSTLIEFLETNAINIVNSVKEINGVYLHFDNDCLCISDKECPKDKPIYVDFLNSQMKKRLLSKNINAELLNKALGKKNNYKTILDATAGMGVDSIIFSALGFIVMAYERSPLVYLLLKNGLERLSKEDDKISELSLGVSLNFGDSSRFTKSVDVIYLDLMFEKVDKKSKSKKGMEVFKKITTKDISLNHEQILLRYLDLDYKRLIFKRPLKSTIINPNYYSHSIKGKAIRYDIYLPRQV